MHNKAKFKDTRGIWNWKGVGTISRGWGNYFGIADVKSLSLTIGRVAGCEKIIQ